MTRLIVGCPIRRREWILPHWFEHVNAATEQAGITDVEFAFVGPPDDPTWEHVTAGAAGRPVHIGHTIEPDYDGTRMSWSPAVNPARLHTMVDLRNHLLNLVRRAGPDLFLSLDSDILLHPQALVDLLDVAAGGYWAVGAGCYLSYGVGAPSVILADRSRIIVPGSTRTGVAAIMAAKLITPAAYWINYRWNYNGEDIGWSHAIREVGGVNALAWTDRHTSRHIRERDEDFYRVDLRLHPQ